MSDKKTCGNCAWYTDGGFSRHRFISSKCWIPLPISIYKLLKKDEDIFEARSMLSTDDAEDCLCWKPKVQRTAGDKP